MGLETDSLSKRLQECTEDVGGFLPMEVRVASIDAHRRMPSCEKSRDLYFLNYYRNISLDAEIRIASYLQVMRCPDYNVVKTIKHALKVEEINQGILLNQYFFSPQVLTESCVSSKLCSQWEHLFGAT